MCTSKSLPRRQIHLLSILPAAKNFCVGKFKFAYVGITQKGLFKQSKNPNNFNVVHQARARQLFRIRWIKYDYRKGTCRLLISATAINYPFHLLIWRSSLKLNGSYEPINMNVSVGLTFSRTKTSYMKNMLQLVALK